MRALVFVWTAFLFLLVVHHDHHRRPSGAAAAAAAAGSSSGRHQDTPRLTGLFFGRRSLNPNVNNLLFGRRSVGSPFFGSTINQLDQDTNDYEYDQRKNDAEMPVRMRDESRSTCDDFNRIRRKWGSKSMKGKVTIIIFSLQVAVLKLKAEAEFYELLTTAY